jgi:hypothetical protein
MIGLPRATPFLALAIAMTTAGCGLYDPPSPVTDPVQVRPPGPIGFEDLAVMRTDWQAEGIDDYAWTVAFGCECLLNGPTTVRVVDGAAVEAVNNGQPVDIASIEGFPLTIDAVFDAVQDTLEGGGTTDAAWGGGTLPRQLNLDRDLQAVDDELGITILEVAPGS